ncbi:DNA recombination protein RmuC [Pseudoalteromonas sp. JC3]|uniref:DNA recombination protein RmuC n=1 Tax=Pseudoalteromonas sp. JC3 TaxID=2810196 RepID=UPI0019D07615|nr:DNA recombination protein RmuC [Pseudoalteromonas sp. JC3]MBR8845940.1 DNA recombination protein RmuC [Pseudoalteromonas sp. JC3]WJE11620.1 DNA recombination protein RmuC [Pseudoalteromonas sp. JC3]
MLWSMLSNTPAWYSLALFAGGAATLLPVVWVMRSTFKNQLNNQLASEQALRSQLSQAEQFAEQLRAQQLQSHGQQQQLQARLAERQRQAAEYQQLWQRELDAKEEIQVHAHELEVEMANLQTLLEQKQLSFEQQLAQLEQAKVQLKEEFHNLANQIFDEKSERFSHQSKEKIQQLLQPVQGELKGFRDKMEAIHSEELKQRASLKTELLHLQANNKAMTEQADRLTTALQGQKKAQGNWGELMLENVLDSAGLRPGYDYQREVNFNTDEGKFRPDVVVYLPQSRHLVIDAKTSLNAYTRYINATTDSEANQAIVAHTEAITARIKELGSKSYERLPGLNSPEVVIMFIPVESAFVEAVKHKPTLYQDALQNNVLVATPTTLLTSLNIVKQLWRFEEQSKHTRELALRAEKFYNKLNSFLHSMEGVGKQLDKAKESYERAFSQLYMGKGNLIKQASEFKELGVAVVKELPEELEEKAKLELEPVSQLGNHDSSK